MSGDYEEDFDSPTDNHELSLSFQDISVLRKSLEKDSVNLSDLNDSPVKDESCSSESSCNEELDSPDDCSPPATPLEEPGIVIEFESKSLSTVSLVRRPATVKKLISDTQSTQPEGLVCPDLRPLMLAQNEEITEFQSKEPSKAITATRSLSAVKRKQHKTFPKSTQDIIDAVTIENKQIRLDSNIQPTQPSTSKDLILTCNDRTNSSSSPFPTIPNTDLSSSDSTNVHNKQELPLKDPSPGADLLPSHNTSKENPLSQLIKPVLVNRYKQKNTSHSTSLVNQSTSVDKKSGDALTEHTLSVITAKVKKMDSRLVPSVHSCKGCTFQFWHAIIS